MKKETNLVRKSFEFSNGVKKQKIAPKKINRSWNLATRMERKRVK